MKTACIIQGNIRSNVNLVIYEMLKHFDWVILSTWEDENLISIQLHEKLIVLSNVKPIEAGYSNRNYQRFSTAEGIRKAYELNCDYILKWRTDMLPLKFNINDLINMVEFNPVRGLTRIVTCSFRCLTTIDDDYSTIPDLFAFGRIDMIKMLWDDSNFNYSKKFNIFSSNLIEQSIVTSTLSNLKGNYCPETELYNLFKVRINNFLVENFEHEFIIKNFFNLIDYKDIDIIWFSGNDNVFRLINTAPFPWWTQATWSGKKNVFKVHLLYPTTFFFNLYSKYRFIVLSKIENIRSRNKLNRYKKNNLIKVNL